MVSETLREVTASLDEGQYRIVSTLKEGRLYLAEKAGRRYVLKTAAGAKGLVLLKREYEISLRMQHPFIASAIAWEESTPIGPAIIMEYIRGRSLVEFLREKPSIAVRRRIFGQLLDAVGAIHRQSIIHNDIKPENILITEADNDVKLIDFGFADGDANIYERGIGGTRQFASPELLVHQETDARSDIYSIGRVMQELFPARYFFIARKCIRVNPDKRFQNIDELKGAWSHRKQSLGIGFFLLMVVLSLGVYFFRSFHSSLPQAKPVPESVTESDTALSRAEAKLREVWEDSFNKVCKEMDRAGYREFLPIHVDYGTYDVAPVLRQISSTLSSEEVQAISSLNETLNLDYSRRLYAKYGSLPSLYDKAINLPEPELYYYRNLASSFKKFTPYPEKDIK